MLPEDVADQGHEFSVLLFACGFVFGQPGVVTGPADLQRGAGGSQRKSLERELFDEGIRFGYTCRLKMANAFFKMSRSRSTRRSSSSSCATRDPRVWAAGPARCRI